MTLPRWLAAFVAIVTLAGMALQLPRVLHGEHENAHLMFAENDDGSITKFVTRNLVLGNPIDVCIVPRVATVISVTGSRCAPPDFGNRSGDPIPGGWTLHQLS